MLVPICSTRYAHVCHPSAIEESKPTKPIYVAVVVPKTGYAESFVIIIEFVIDNQISVMADGDDN